MNRSIIITLAKESAKTYLNKGLTIKTTPDLPSWLGPTNFGVFVTFLDYAKNIRSQAGSIKPTKDNLGTEIITQTIKAVKGNDVYKPISKDEINGLKLQIFIILKTEAIYNITSINTATDGILVVKNQKQFGLVLPRKISPDSMVKIACRNGKIDWQNDHYKIYRLSIEVFSE